MRPGTANRGRGFVMSGGGFLHDGITPRPGDGRISRADAAKLAKVDADTVSAWISRGLLTDVRREGRRVWLSPVEVIEVEWKCHQRERQRIRKVLGITDDALDVPA